MQDFWAVYEADYDQIVAETLPIVSEHPQFGPLVRSLTRAQLEEQNRASKERLRRVFRDNDWQENDDILRVQGKFYALQGIRFSSWYDITKLFVSFLLPRLVNTYAHDPARLTRVLLCMQEFLDYSMVALGETYLEASKAALRESEQRLAITLDSIGDAVIATDPEGRVVRMNPVAEQLTGWKRGEAVGRPMADVFCPVREDTGAPVEDPVQRVLKEGTLVGLANHTALVARDGRRLPISDSAAPIRGEDGALVGVVLVFRDMSEERKAEARLRMWEQVLTGADWGATLVDARSGALEMLNPAFARMHGYTVEEALALRNEDFFAPEVRPGLQAQFRLIHERGSLSWESLHVHRDGSTFPVLNNCSVIRDERGEIRYRSVSTQDITEHKRMEAVRLRSVALEAENRRVQEASRLKSEFLANMSHELRTPLNAIIGFAELLYDGEVSPDMPQHKEFLGDILTSGRHLLQLINDVLDLSKVEAGKLEFHPEAVDLGRLIGEVVAVLRTVAASKRLRVELALDAELIEVELDAGRLKQVLYNYLSNALKFTPDGGSVVVRTARAHDGSFRLEVEDTGQGIAPEDIERLFVEFQQLDAGAAKKHAGTGLGLALTRRLVEAQGGSVGVRSTPGAGSVFYAVLPVRAVGGRPLPAPRSFPGDGPTVLVVEDDERDQGLLVRTLIEFGYTVETAATGAQALARCQERAFDAITLDLLLPDKSGLEVLRSLRGSDKNRDVPVIVITVVTEGAAAGFAVHDVLPKPIDGAALLESLTRAGVRREPPDAVLVVDDDASSLKLMAANLGQLGYRALCVTSGAEGLRAAGETPPAAVVLDLLMPEMNGFAFLERFRRLPRCRRTPVFIWTVKDLTAEEHAQLCASAQAVLLKGRDSSATVLEELCAFLPARGEEPA